MAPETGFAALPVQHAAERSFSLAIPWNIRPKPLSSNRKMSSFGGLGRPGLWLNSAILGRILMMLRLPRFGEAR
jgi:hypothetical protein